MDIDALRFQGRVRVVGRAEVVETDATVEAEPAKASGFRQTRAGACQC